MAITNQALPAGLNISKSVLGSISQIRAEISPVQWLLITIILILVYHHLKLQETVSRLNAIIIFQDETRLESFERFEALDESFNNNAKETAQALERIGDLEEHSIKTYNEGVDRAEDLEKDLRRLRVLEWGQQLHVGKCIDCLSKRMDYISAKVECLELQGDSGSVVYTPMDGDGDDDERLDEDCYARDRRAEAATDDGGDFSDLESEEDYYDEDEHEAEMKAELEAELEAELQAVMEEEMYSDRYLAEEKEERQRSVSKVEAYLRGNPDVGGMNNDQLELDRILGEQEVCPHENISSFELDPVNDVGTVDEEREETDSRENSDRREY